MVLWVFRSMIFVGVLADDLVGTIGYDDLIGTLGYDDLVGTLGYMIYVMWWK